MFTCGLVTSCYNVLAYVLPVTPFSSVIIKYNLIPYFSSHPNNIECQMLLLF